MTKDELLLRLKGCEWNDFEVKEASGGLPKSMWETVGVIYPLAVKSGQNEVVRKGGRINNDSDGLGADRQAYISANSGQNEVVRKSGRIQGEETRTKIVEAMRRKPEISRRELAEIVGISPSAIQKHVEFLKEAEIIVRLGSDRKGLWKVLK